MSRPHNLKIIDEGLTKLVADGLTDSQIADRIGVHVKTVFARRKKAGIASRYDPADPPDHVRAARAEAGRKSLPKARAADAARHRAVSARYGLPPMRPKAVRIVLALLNGPLTKAAIRSRMGGWLATENDPLTELVRNGIVVRARMASGSARKLNPDVYMLPVQTLEVLIANQGSDGRPHGNRDG